MKTFSFIKSGTFVWKRWANAYCSKSENPRQKNYQKHVNCELAILSIIYMYTGVLTLHSLSKHFLEFALFQFNKHNAADTSTSFH